MATEPAEILIVGAGPTGLMLGVWLAASGVRARIVDPKPGPTPETRAVAVQARTLELWDRLDIADRALERGHRTTDARFWVRGKEVAQVHLGEIGQGLSPYPFVFMLGQDQTEALLYERLRELGGDVEWGTRASQIADRRVTLTNGRGEETAEFRFIAGCDGASSLVRHAAGLDFPGGTYEARFYVADVHAVGGIAPGALNLALFENRFLAFFPLKEANRFRLIGLLDPALATERATIDDVRPEVQKLTHTTISDVRWFSVYRVHHRVVERFYQGPLFLLGDAAHVHSPVGGQGMNTGLGDAANLAWKLAAVVKHGADPRLLDTYDDERRPFAQSLVATTDRAFELVVRQTTLAKFVRLNLFPRLAASLLSLSPFRKFAFGRVSQIQIEYRESPLSRGRSGHFVAGDRLRPELAGQGVAWRVVAPLSETIRQWCKVRGIDYRVESSVSETLLVRPDGYLGGVFGHFEGDALDRYLAERVGLNLSA